MNAHNIIIYPASYIYSIAQLPIVLFPELDNNAPCYLLLLLHN